MDHSTSPPPKDNLGPTALVIAWVFLTFAMSVVGTRYYVRLRIVKRFAIDDWLILLTTALAIGNSIFVTISVHWGLGQHMANLSQDQIMYTVKWVYLCEFFSIMSPGFGRISFALLLLGIIPPAKWRFRFLWTIISIQFVVDLGTVIISFSQCRPIRGFWDHSVDAGCWPAYVQQYAGFFQGSVCSVVDLVLALFPTSLFWNLNMALRQKVSLSIMMGLGVFAMVASIVKTVELRAISEKADATHAMAVLAIWWTLEANLVLIAASIPTLKPVLKMKATGSTTGRSKGSRITSSHLSRNRAGNNNSFVPLGDSTSSPDEEELKAIRKDTTTTVTYEEGTSLESGSIGRW